MKSCLLCLAIVIASFFCPVVLAQQESLEECRKLQLKIERYDELRSNGGSGPQMDAWNRSRRALEKQFRTGGCRYYRWELK